MKNRNNVLHELDKIDGLVSQLNFIIKRSEPIESYMLVMEKLKDTASQARSYVENEQISGYELNIEAR